MEYGFTLLRRGPLARLDTLAAIVRHDEELAAGLKRLASYADRASRDPAQIEVTYRIHQHQLAKGAQVRPAGIGGRRPFTGSATQIAGDIHQYEEMGVGYLAVDFARQSRNLDEMLVHMGELATRVWPRV
jgi:alkanesulfonate monooxygenase SsuD/methylene tetrahydromethanopterin reductase-like flavin-dependent oxidoreductase (luciferase family)